MENLIPRRNNFDLIRLLAALQVVYGHSLAHLKIENTLFHFSYLKYFPGVPIFFTVSGFLIFWAYDRNPILKKYMINRSLRLYPALYICLALTIFMLLISSSGKFINHKEFYAWILTQISFFQFYTPDILRFWGVGTPNGSLWTIAVEVQFYILVPLLFLLFKLIKREILLLSLIIISIFLNFIFSTIPENIFQKLTFVSIAPYLFNFLIGSLFYIYWDKLRKVIENKFFFWFFSYILYVTILGEVLGYSLLAYQMDNILQVFSVFFLAFVILSFAFSFKNLSENLLNNNDISYGIYIYHMLVVNTLVEMNFINEIKYLILVFIVTIILAYASWKIIEKPALGLKNKIK